MEIEGVMVLASTFEEQMAALDAQFSAPAKEPETKSETKPETKPEKKPETKPKLTEVERLEQQLKRQKEQGKKTTAKLAKARRAEKRKAEQAAKKKRQDKALAFLEYCESTKVDIAVTLETGEEKKMQLYDYVLYNMGLEGKAFP